MSDTPDNGKLTKIEKAPVLGDSRGLKPASLDEMFRIATLVVNSGEFKDINTPAQAMIRMQAGMELGLGWLWSLVNIMVVNGRPSVWGDCALGLVQRHPEYQDHAEDRIGNAGEDSFGYQCTIWRKGKQPKVGTFTVAEAKLAKLWGKPGPWQTYPTRMLQMRARAFAMRDAFADALRGLSVIEEVRDIEPRAVVEREKPTVVLPDEVTSREPLTEPMEVTLL